MTLFFRLFFLQLNQRFGLSALRVGFRDDRKKTLVRGSVVLVAMAAIAYMVGLYTWLVSKMMPAFQSLGMETAMLGVVLLASMLMVFFLGMFYLLGVLFFAKDTELLASLPIPQGTVFAAKFSQVLLSEVFTGAIMLLPPFIIYGISVGADALYWVRMVLVALTAPCVPLALSGIISLLLMRFNALWRHRDILTTVGAVALTVGAMLGQFALTSKMPEIMTPEALTALLSDNSGVIKRLAAGFPPAGWAAQGVAGDNWQLLLYVLSSIAALVLVVFIAGRIYYGGAAAQLESASNKRSVRIAGGAVKSHGSIRALLAREWRTVLRTPIYALNSLIVIIVGPIMLLLPKFMSGMATDPEMEQLFAFLTESVDMKLMLLVLSGLFMLISSINTGATTSLSREGKLFYLSRLIPVAPEKQALAKFFFGLTTAGLTMLAMGGVGMVSMGLPVVEVVLPAFALGLVACVAPLSLSMIPDILRPKLSWNSENEAIKQNMNGMLGMLISWAYVALLGFGCYKALAGGMDSGLVTAVVAVVSVVFGAAALWGLCKAARRSWRMIEG